MRDDVARDLSDSAYEFERVVWPAIRHLCGGGRLQPVETTATRDFRRDLDILAGIDAWQIIDGRGMRGIASRIQWGERSWGTFTVRKARVNGIETEEAKRLRAYLEPERGWLLPHLTVQAYVSKPKRQGCLVAAAVIRTSDLCDAIVRHGPSRAGLRNGADQTSFDAYSWAHLQELGYQVRITGSPESLAALGAAVRRLVVALSRWAHKAACNGMELDDFYPVNPEVVPEAAQEACARCPVFSECLDHALIRPERHGVWAGLSERERQLIRRRKSYTALAADRRAA